ncbi:MAG: glutathione S-transferase family protein [Symploca sp. SIO3C6]|uniref:Glutathione S-transferase family protein n=1 Tax=Symploca sp. SIO1C4 TaxID=2607765 RepID=A0A6B3NG34_9CYAN|nr:glutathione S-transferase family protein [Symploca sp. SIO3C6]NER30633.1 glutathione S-transferase family protein [Symploca sp. SIO1C4]NET07255.1 glutathione S-transferase family protein [Symploca sp. SIO2B6]
MGLLIDGVWHDYWYDTKKTKGHFMRQGAQFRNWVTADGSAGPSGKAGFKAELGRYHLYVSYACPWAHRTLIFRALKGLEEIIPVSIVHWLMREEGWTFQSGEGVIPDNVNHVQFLRELYTKTEPTYTGRVTVPVLWDKKTGTIVNNESSEIIRIFNSAFDSVGALSGDYYPEALRDEIEALNTRIYDTVNNGVYKAGFATTQEAYEQAFHPLFETLDWLEERLSRRRYLTGEQITEADWRLFTTLLRFDCVYVGHFKCNKRRLADYPNLWAYVRELYQMPKVAETVNFKHIKSHYYQSQVSINPTQVVPIGPEIDFTAPHGRDTKTFPRAA